MLQKGGRNASPQTALGKRMPLVGSASDITGRRSMVVTPSELPLPPGSRTYPAPTSTQTSSRPLEVRQYHSSLPTKVIEACMASVGHDQISVKVEESGWAWLVRGAKVIIWKICQTAVTKMSKDMSKDLQLPNCGTSDHIAITSERPLEAAPAHAVSVLAVVGEGAARFWPSLAYPGSYTNTDLHLGELCNFVVAVKGGDFIVCSYSGQLLRVSVNSSGRLQHRAIQQSHRLLSGISGFVSHLLGTPPPVLRSVLVSGELACLYTLTGSTLSKWVMDKNSERLLFTWDARRALGKPITDALWGSGMKEEMNVAYLDVKLSQAGRLVLLAAAWCQSDSPRLARHCLVTLNDNGATISDWSVVVTQHNPPFLEEKALHATRLLLPRVSGPLAFLYNKELVFACSIDTGGEKLEITSVCGGGCCDNLPVFFSKNRAGFVVVLAKEIAPVLPGTMEDSLWSSVAAEPSSPAVIPDAILSFKASVMESPGDKTRCLKVAFHQFCRKDVVGAQNLTGELFPPEAEDELDSVVSRMSLDLLDAYSASDPRWAQSVSDQSASGFHLLTSLIVLHQLEDKLEAHGCFMDFLLQVGLLDRLSQVVVRSAPMATRLFLCEHGEKLQAAVVLRKYHSQHAELINRAILGALQKNNVVVPPGLTPADVFFREVSQVSSVLECLLEEERTLESEVVVNVNNIIKDMLQAACHYRESKAFVYRPGRNAANEPEYVPWTASGGARGVRGIISRQHKLVLSSVYPAAGPELRSMLCWQLCALLDVYLGGYVSQLNSLPCSQQERYTSLEMEYSQCRSKLLTELLELRQYQCVAALAEKYSDFDTLVQLCEQTDDQGRLQSYVTTFANQNFIDFVVRWYMQKGKSQKLFSLLSLLSLPSAQNEQLASILQAQHLSWLNHIHTQDFQSAHRILCDQAKEETSFVKKKTLLALSKLSALASDMPTDASHVPEDALQKQVHDILVQERVLLHQETLPKQLLEERQMNPDVMPVLTAHNLISLYVCDDNRQANEHDFKKALDLLEYVDEKDVKDLKCYIFGKALTKDNWSFADRSNNPLEAAADTIFIRILLNLIQEGVPLQTYLPDVKDLLDLDELARLRSKPSFEYALRANYEYYVKKRSFTHI